MIILRRAAAGTAAWLAALALLGGLPTTAHADSTDNTAQPPPKVELILDVSGSMRTPDIGGMSRISAAQHALDEVVDALPDQDQVGLRTLGATYPGNNKAVGCKDTQLMVPIGPLNRVEMKTDVATLRPLGWTPIGLALRDAAKDLGVDSSSRHIVLVTDGEDDCAPPDPCDVARALAADGTHLTVDTLGLTEDDKVRRQLSCIAQATGGTYTEVRTEGELSTRLTQLVQSGTTQAAAPPAPTTGTDACATAPVLRPGVWTDRQNPQQESWYRVAVPAGQELRASASIAIDRPVAPHYDITMRATTADGRELARGAGASSGRNDVVSTGLRAQAPVADASASSAGSDSSASSASATAADTTSAAPTGSTPTDGTTAGPTGSPSTDTTATTTGSATDGMVCLSVANALSVTTVGAGNQPGFPVELSIDVVPGASASGGGAQWLGSGWALVGLLALIGLVSGLIFGWLARWRVAVWRAP
ncbi:VWA domain-containing protein [Streptacidiphilus neutrinimicus]|uniref:VWA domain-containing protein n=1 Tax=Streptacidiphilus neutrinimicus TaxID=105420 RepID=UPI0005A7EA4C|nr:VWA domain-containing protein [Streptacidiphilus neutrinimicus]